MSDSGTKARFYHAVKDAHMAHLIKVDLKADLFSYRVMRLPLKSLFAALDLTPPTPSDLAKPVL